MGDIKVYNNEKQLQQTLKIIKKYSDDLHMKLGLKNAKYAQRKARSELTDNYNSEIIHEKTLMQSFWRVK